MGEGPIFHEDRLIYVDIEGHTLIRLDPMTGKEETWNVGERIGTVVPWQRGGSFVQETLESIFLDPDLES